MCFLEHTFFKTILLPTTKRFYLIEKVNCFDNSISFSSTVIATKEAPLYVFQSKNKLLSKLKLTLNKKTKKVALVLGLRLEKLKIYLSTYCPIYIGDIVGSIKRHE